MTDQLTDSEAAVLRYAFLLPSEKARASAALVMRKLESGRLTDLGRSALAAYDARKRAEIRRPHVELVRHLTAALRYIQQPTCGYDGRRPIDEWVMSPECDEKSVRLALKTCIEIARMALNGESAQAAMEET